MKVEALLARSLSLTQFLFVFSRGGYDVRLYFLFWLYDDDDNERSAHVFVWLGGPGRKTEVLLSLSRIRLGGNGAWHGSCLALR